MIFNRVRQTHTRGRSMSWDVSIIKLSKRFGSVAEIPGSKGPLYLGGRTSVHAAVSRVFPGTDWTDPAWGTWDGPHGSIEFNLGEADDVDSFMLHVRAGPEVAPMIVALCISNDREGLDCSTGQFLEKSFDPAAGFRGWRDYVNQIQTK
jgi:hypothetical protein